MKHDIANYTVVINKEKRTGTDKTCYSALVPALGIATDADTLEAIQKEVQTLIQFHLDSLAQEGEEIVVENSDVLVTRSQVILPENAQVTTN
jgi:predicted RNase H-like HicB family nuclease